MVGMRDFLKGKGKVWPRTRKQKFFAWGGALAINLALFSVLAMTMELKIGFALPNMRNPLPVEVISAEDFAALNKPEPTPPPKRQIRLDRIKPAPEPDPLPEPEPEPEPIKIPELKPEEEKFEPPQPQSPPEPLIEEVPIEDLPIAETFPLEEPPVEEPPIEELTVEEEPLAEIVPVEEAPLADIIEEPVEEVMVEGDLVEEPVPEEPELAETMPPEDAPFIEQEAEQPPIEALAEQEPDPFAITAERPDSLPEEEIEEEEAVAEIGGDPEQPPVANAPPANPDDPYAGLSGPEIDALYKQRSLPAVNLPQANAGGSSGVTAIFCPDVFDNDDKVQECAGRPEIRSGWQPGNEDWSEVIDSLQRGGVATISNPQTGPAGDRKPVPGSRHAPLTTEEAILGRGTAENIQDAKGIAALKENSLGVENVAGADMGEGMVAGEFYINGGWEPNWTLSDKTRMEREMLEKMRALERQGQSIDLEKDKE